MPKLYRVIYASAVLNIGTSREHIVYKNAVFNGDDIPQSEIMRLLDRSMITEVNQEPEAS
jgi:hypothetical protein